MNQRAMLAMLLPVAAVLSIALYAGGLGVIFMVLFGDPRHEPHSAAGEWYVVALGIVITITVPAVAYLWQRRIEKQ